MGSTVRTLAAVIASTALAGALIGVCPCVDSARATADDHGCCVPQPGLRAASHDCCGRSRVTPGLTSAPTPPAASVDLPLDGAFLAPDARQRTVAPAPLLGAARSPVLRI